mmetsp:Transcript_97960/g.165089  ORF Transcript_97960/g.165089 Transcript_97960/m.165089 type:complete len:341 (-) Transcript_97960:3437-4459(-)
MPGRRRLLPAPGPRCAKHRASSEAVVSGRDVVQGGHGALRRSGRAAGGHGIRRRHGMRTAVGALRRRCAEGGRRVHGEPAQRPAGQHRPGQSDQAEAAAAGRGSSRRDIRQVERCRKLESHVWKRHGGLFVERAPTAAGTEDAVVQQPPSEDRPHPVEDPVPLEHCDAECGRRLLAQVRVLLRRLLRHEAREGPGPFATSHQGRAVHRLGAPVQDLLQPHLRCLSARRRGPGRDVRHHPQRVRCQPDDGDQLPHEGHHPAGHAGAAGPPAQAGVRPDRAELRGRRAAGADGAGGGAGLRAPATGEAPARRRDPHDRPHGPAVPRDHGHRREPGADLLRHQ